jgi:hypothetical protein
MLSLVYEELIIEFMDELRVSEQGTASERQRVWSGKLPRFLEHRITEYGLILYGFLDYMEKNSLFEIRPKMIFNFFKVHERQDVARLILGFETLEKFFELQTLTKNLTVNPFKKINFATGECEEVEIVELYL